ncbi:hypothetical protein CR513_61043, partial [Mucuna pruriens]
MREGDEQKTTFNTKFDLYEPQIKQVENRIYIIRLYILRSYSKNLTLKIYTTSILSLNKTDNKIDQISYRNMMIYSLFYLTTSILDITFIVCLCVGITNFILCYKKYNQYRLKDYDDANFVRDRIEKKLPGEDDYDIIESNIHLLYDNTTVINLFKNLILHSRAKHIEIKYHFISNYVQKGSLDLKFTSTENQ